ncbi:MAG: hypothetical protein H6905_00360 [Hyphomicrobiales bacterium]|nr:hypothetical protein [Hyphomicrobiales bacterium]
MEHDVIRTFVRERYAGVVKPSEVDPGCCAPVGTAHGLLLMFVSKPRSVRLAERQPD